MGVIVLDTSILINFVKVGQVDLLGRVGSPILVLDQVLAEVIMAEQRAPIDAAISAGAFDFQSVTDLTELMIFAELRADGRLGAGECAVLAVAINRNLIAGLDDQRARAEALRKMKSLRLCRTEDLVLTLIQRGELTVEAADNLLVEWATRHRFKSSIRSFRDLL